jgi:nicotinate-nucleotide pyrophosphorylase (carboxylating)
MHRDYPQIPWNEQLEDDCRQIVRLAVREDLDRGCDWTTVSLVPADRAGKAEIVTRQRGVIAGIPALVLALREMNIAAEFVPRVADGDSVEAGAVIASLAGKARDLLTAERLLLNLLGRMSGIATLTRRYVDAVSGKPARIYDTRKTTPGWRRLEKYAVRCGGGWNHRVGLFSAVLVKDNHLAFLSGSGSVPGGSPAEAGDRSSDAALAVECIKKFLSETDAPAMPLSDMLVEVEVDSLTQLDGALRAGPDIVLLDNMTRDQLRQAVACRDAVAPEIELEASGGITLETVRSVAETGVERISVGALTHAAASLDVSLDWLT